MVDVRRYYQAASCYLGANELRVEGFALGDELHGGGDLAIAREAHLGSGGTWCRYGHLRLPTPVRTGSGSTGLSQPRAAEVWRGAPRSVSNCNERRNFRRGRQCANDCRAIIWQVLENAAAFNKRALSGIKLLYCDQYQATIYKSSTEYNCFALNMNLFGLRRVAEQ